METDQESDPQITDAQEVPDPESGRLVRLGGLSTTCSSVAGQTLAAKKISSSPQRQLSNHLTWSRIKAGWAEFKQSADSVE